LLSSIFTTELTNITHDTIQKFCDQKIPESQKIEYKVSFPEKIKLEREICALGNTLGGIIFIGVEADTKTNIPIAIPGITLKEGLEEKIINKCLSWINPPLLPEVKVCAFDSDNKAVIFIRVPKSIHAPHEIMRDNEILVRAHNRIAKANLNTIEQLLERRNQQSSGGISHHLSNSYKNIDANENDFQSVVLAPKLGLQSRLTFNNTLDNDLRKASDVVHHWNDIKRAPHKIEFFSKTRDGMKLAYAQIFSDGRVTYQEPTNLKEKALYYSRPLQFLKRCIEAAEKVYPIFGYHGEIEVGLSINGVNNVKLEFPSRILVREGGNICEIPMIYIQRTIDLRELDMLHEIFKSIFNEYCRWFDLSWDDDTITSFISELYPLASAS
jgi:hypothetical protein